MKKTVLGILILCAAVSPVLAVEEEDVPKEEAGSLVDIGESSSSSTIRELNSRIDDNRKDSRYQDERIRNLERRVDELRREVRSQDERVRSMERTVNDLRRLRP